MFTMTASTITTSTPNTDRLAVERARWVAAGTIGRPFFVECAAGVDVLTDGLDRMI